LHYLQDYSVDPTEKLWIFRYRSGKVHEEREGGLHHLPIDLKAVEEAAKTRCYPHEFKSTVYNMERGKTAEEIMRLSSYLTSLAIKLVVNPDKPENLEKDYSRAFKLHLAVVAIPWILVAFDINSVPLSAILSYVAHKLDFNYSKWKINYDWFEVKG
jgi:hypothetical protein